MADLSDNNSAQTTKIVGADPTGTEQTPVQSTAAGGLHTNLRDTNGEAVGTKANPIYINGNAELLSPLPSLKVTDRRILAPGAAYYTANTITTKTAIKELHFGGRQAGEGTLSRFTPANTEQVPGGGFNSQADRNLWVNTGVGDSTIPTWTYTTSQKYEGTGSVTMNFTKSDGNNYPELTYVWATPQDLSRWRFIHAYARVSVASGGGQTRSVQIRITSGTAVRIWQITGNTQSAPFSTEQWLPIVGELENPHATAGTGVFDINNVTSISLRLVDGGNKAGTLYFDHVHFMGEIDVLEKIYSNGPTIQLEFDPVIVFNPGDCLMLIMRNNAQISAEFQVAASGVDVT